MLSSMSVKHSMKVGFPLSLVNGCWKLNVKISTEMSQVLFFFLLL